MGFCDRIIHKYHSTTANGHLGREKTFTTVSRDFLWLHVYKWVRNWIRTCEICQRRVHSIAAGPPVPVADCSWGLPFTLDGHYLRSCARYLKSNKYPVFVERFNKMTNMVNVHVTIIAAETAVHFIDAVFLYHGLRKISFLTVTLYSHLYCGKAIWGNLEWSMGWLIENYDWSSRSIDWFVNLRNTAIEYQDTKIEFTYGGQGWEYDHRSRVTASGECDRRSVEIKIRDSDRRWRMVIDD